MNATNRFKPGQFPAEVRCAGAIVRGTVELPAEAEGLVVSASVGSEKTLVHHHGIKSLFHAAKLGIAAMNLSADEPQRNATMETFDIALLAARLLASITWLREQTAGRFPIGLLCEGGAVVPALLAAAEPPSRIISAVVVGGRPDLAGKALRFVSAPTLLVVGSDEDTLLTAHQRAFNELTTTKSLEIVLGAGEALTIDSLRLVARSATGWLSEHLCPAEAKN